MQYPRNLIVKVLDPYKCDWRYAFILEHFHKSFNKVNKQGKNTGQEFFLPQKVSQCPPKL